MSNIMSEKLYTGTIGTEGSIEPKFLNAAFQWG